MSEGKLRTMYFERWIKRLIVVQLLWLIAIVLAAPTGTTYKAEFGLFDLLILFYLLTYFYSLQLIYRCKRLGRTLFAASCLAGALLTLASPEYSSPMSNYYELLIWFGGVLDGVMLAIMYFTELKHRFE